MDVGNRIRELREKKGFSVNHLANLAGVSQSHLRAIELGEKNPTVETLSYFCDALGLSLKDFFDFETKQASDDLFFTAALRHLNTQQKKTLAEFINSLFLNQ